MRISKYPLFTRREIPTDSEIVSHQLMLRAGMIRKLSSGIYSWLPTGLRVLRKIENFIREKMNNIGAIEILMPIVQPGVLWQKSNRLVDYGPELLQFSDRNERKFIFGPTNEEVITSLISNECSSYKEFPLIFYQIQTKFRDEMRPRSGMIRSREFIMKDAYSFHVSKKSLKTTYDILYKTYNEILNKMKLNFRVIRADNGPIGGNSSDEFQVISKNGEDNIVLSTKSNYSSNLEFAPVVIPSFALKTPKETMQMINTKNVSSIKDLVTKFNISRKKIIKIFLVHAKKELGYPLIALAIRGDHKLNKFKVKKLPKIAIPLTFATEKEITLAIGANSYSLGPVNLPVPLIIDQNVAIMSDFIAGANINGKHFFGINWQRDLPIPEIADLRYVENDDISPDGRGKLKIENSIEVGHIFQLGIKYSEAINASVKNISGQNQFLLMGCYGIGISRLIAAIIEQNNDNLGILWPEIIAPFKIVIIPINMYNSSIVKNTAEMIYNQLCITGIEVLFYDREERPGVMFTDSELIGIPHIVIIGEKKLKNDKIEYINRRDRTNEILHIHDMVNFLISKLSTKNF